MRDQLIIWRMTAAALFAVLVILLAGGFAARDEEPAGKYAVAVTGSDRNGPDQVYRVDTQTGKTWMLNTFEPKNRFWQQ